MKKEEARLTVLLDADRKEEFAELCRSLGTNTSSVVRELIVRFLRGDAAPLMWPPDDDASTRADGEID